MARVVVSGLRKVYRSTGGESVVAVDGVSFEVGDGELLVMAGASGSGKTTSLRLIAGLERACAGTVEMEGRVIDGLKPHERDVAMVFQSDALFPHLSAYENMALGLKLRKVEKGEIARRVEAAAEMLEVTGLLKRFPGELSGGERRRVALGRAMVRRPKLFLLDEPFANLDAGLRGRMRELVRRMHTELKATMLLVTHDVMDAQGSRTVILERGQVVRREDADKLSAHP